jgi:hypothetical protein
MSGIAACTAGPPRHLSQSVATSRAVNISSSAFCVFLAKLDAAAARANTATEGLRVLKTLDSPFERAAASAPSAAAPDLRVILTATRQALARHDLSPLATDDVAQAGSRLSQECGLTSS